MLAHKPLEPQNDGTLSTILVVEDEILVRMVIAEYLRDCGFRVIEASNAAEAITILEADDAVDLVFSDVHMPGQLDGFGLAQWVRRMRPEVEVILTSGVARATHDATELCGDSPLIAKPYHQQDIERRIRALLAARRRPSDES